jgi:molybdopterin/thiamine biosynthesis adenylyltransferase
MNHRIAIFGLGTIGANLAKNLMLFDARLDLVVIDSDKVEERNLFTQLYWRTHLGQPKTDALLAMAYEVLGHFPEHLVTLNRRVDDKFSGASGATLLVDAFDNFKSRDILHGLAKKRHIPVVHLGFSPEFIATILWNDKYVPNQSGVEGQDVCEVREMSWWLQGVVAIMTKNILDFLQTQKMSSQLIDRNFQIKKLDF